MILLGFRPASVVTWLWHFTVVLKVTRSNLIIIPWFLDLKPQKLLLRSRNQTS